MRIKVGAAGVGEARGDLGKAGEDDAHGSGRENDGQDAGASEERRQDRGQAEDSAADNAIHGEGGKAPAADGTD